MRILVVGAGATGGYFGGRLAEAGREVTFLVRARRAAQLAANALVIKSMHGDFTLPSPRTVLSENIAGPFDLILLSCKAYDLDSAIDAIAPAVGPGSAILPVLNGMRHLDVLDARFGRQRVLGGQCIIAATLDERGAIVHLNDAHSLTFGERDGGLSDRVRAIAEAMSGARFDARPSEQATQEMWEKWTALATLAASTCLMRAAIGDILAAPAGQSVICGLLSECASIAEANGHAPRAAFIDKMRAALLEHGSTLTASMLRDVERNGPTEADHIIGDLLARRPKSAGSGSAPSLLQLAYSHLKAYDARRARSAAPG
ncbi:MAG TPA: 2-dehydropantoate 2-reductase [Rudaea sp.]|nr:2-dehydropantoate 2-reductase [Rudaea sp.]